MKTSVSLPDCGITVTKGKFLINGEIKNIKIERPAEYLNTNKELNYPLSEKDKIIFDMLMKGEL